MVRKVAFLFLIILSVSFRSYSQIVSQLNAQYNISKVSTITAGSVYQLQGTFTDLSNAFTATKVTVGDQVIDLNGVALEITSINSISGTALTVTGNLINTSTKPPAIGLGIIYHPTTEGYSLITNSTPASLLAKALNSSIISINNDIPKFGVCNTLPNLDWSLGSAVVYSSSVYQYTSSGWSIVSPIGTQYGATINDVPIKAAGTIIKFYTDGKYYISDGTIWTLIQTVTSLPTVQKSGDIYYVSGENILYMLVDDGAGNTQWMAISSAGISTGGNGDFPGNPKPGMLYFNTDNNTLYIFDMTNTWVEISTNGSTPGDMNNPDPAMSTIKEGRLFYNTSEHQLYVYNGSIWIPLGNALADGQIYVGNTSNIATAVSLSGDATITSAGKLTINNAAITDSKLDKANIPLSGFGNAKSNISMGDGSTNYRISNLLNPAVNQDAATKGYVDNLLANPSSSLTLNYNNFFVGNALNKAVSTAKTSIPLSGFGVPTANISMNGKQINNLASPSLGTDAVTKDYVDNKSVYPINIGLNYNMLLQGNAQDQAGMVEKKDIPVSDFGAATANISLGGFKLTTMADPVAAQDASTKNYVDTKIFPSTNIELASGNLLVGNSSGVAAATLKNAIPLSGFGAATADISMGTSRIVSLGAPIADTDASTKKYVDDLFLNPSNILSLAAGSFFVGNSFGKAAPTIKASIPISGFGKATETVYMGDPSTQYNISNLAEPMSGKDAATKNYVDTKIANPSSITVATGYILVGNAANQAEAVAKSTIPLSDFGAVNANLSLGNYKITNLADPVSDGDAVNKKYVTTQLSNVNTLLSLPEGQLFVGNASGKAIATVRNTIPLSGFAIPTTDIAFGTKKITGLGDPTTDQDAATKKYVDNLITSSALPALTDGKIFVGNASGKASPVSLSGDASIDNTGKMTIANDAVSAAKLNADVAGTGLKQNLSGALEVDAASISGGSISSSDLQVTGGSNAVLTNVTISIPNKAITDAKLDKANIPLSGFGAPTANLTAGSFKITNLSDPTADQDATTKKYVDDLMTSSALPALTDGKIFVGNALGKASPVSLSGDASIDNTGKMTIANDAVSAAKLNADVAGTGLKQNLSGALEVDATTISGGSISSSDLQVTGGSNAALTNVTISIPNKAITDAKLDKTNIPLSGFALPTTDIAFGTKKITGLGDPTTDQDAATKKYVDDLITSSALPALTDGNIFVGNASDQAVSVPLSGDASIDNTGKMTIANDAVSAAKLNADVAGTGLKQNLSGALEVDAASITGGSISSSDLLVTGGSNAALTNVTISIPNKAITDAKLDKANIPLSGFGAPTANLTAGSFKITNLSDPTADQDATTKKYVDDLMTSSALPALTDGKIFVGNALGKASPVSLSGDATIDNTGKMAITDNAITNAKLDKANIPLSGFALPTTDIAFGTKKITGLGDPTADQDATTKKYVDDLMTSSALPALTDGNIFVGNASGKASSVSLSGDATIDNTGKMAITDNAITNAKLDKANISLTGFGAPTTNLSAGSFRITNLSDPTVDQDAATKKYVDDLMTSSALPALTEGNIFVGNALGKASAVSLSGDATIDNTGKMAITDNAITNAKLDKANIPLSGFALPTTDIAFGTKKITGLGDPTADQDATTKKYVDGLVAGVTSVLLLPKGNMLVGDDSGKAASTAKSAITLSGFKEAEANISMGSGSNNYKIINLANPSGDQDAATKKYVDVTAAASKDNLGNHTATQALKMGSYSVSNDGDSGDGVVFDTDGNATFGKDVTVNGNFYTPSDKRLKTDIATLTNVLEKINNLRGVQFEYKDQKKYAKGPKMGVIAQELLLVYPEMVTKGDDGYLKVDYTQLTAVLIQAVKEQQQQLKQQQQDIDEMKVRLDQQQLQINSILKELR